MQDVSGEQEGLQHRPVLPAEVLTGLNVQAGGRFIDGTLGGGGHTQLLLHHTRLAATVAHQESHIDKVGGGQKARRQVPKDGVGDGQILGLDVDPAAIRRVRERFPGEISAGRLSVAQAPFDQIGEIARQRGFTGIDGILLDLGLSSFQLDTPARGFAFRHDGPLDMRFDPSTGYSAAELINSSSWEEIADILFQYGEERQSRPIARAIVANRPVSTTAELADIVRRAVRRRGWQKIHPATRTFQALRIAVNDELGQLERALPQIPGLLRDGGRVAIIAFHSLEDRLVKRWMRDHARRFRPDPTLPTGGQEQIPALSIYNKKPIVPAAAEIERNPRSRSARLRIAEKRSEP
jgi:16S rRNA (cytosine1402-N4)-methyltransferase